MGDLKIWVAVEKKLEKLWPRKKKTLSRKVQSFVQFKILVTSDTKSAVQSVLIFLPEGNSLFILVFDALSFRNDSHEGALAVKILVYANHFTSGFIFSNTVCRHLKLNFTLNLNFKHTVVAFHIQTHLPVIHCTIHLCAALVFPLRPVQTKHNPLKPPKTSSIKLQMHTYLETICTYHHGSEP